MHGTIYLHLMINFNDIYRVNIPYSTRTMKSYGVRLSYPFSHHPDLLTKEPVCPVAALESRNCSHSPPASPAKALEIRSWFEGWPKALHVASSSWTSSAGKSDGSWTQGPNEPMPSSKRWFFITNVSDHTLKVSWKAIATWDVIMKP